MENGEESGVEIGVQCGELRVERGVWKAKSGESRVESAEWRVESGVWLLSSRVLHIALCVACLSYGLCMRVRGLISNGAFVSGLTNGNEGRLPDQFVPSTKKTHV